MSTLPEDSWRDAGLVDPDDATSLIDDATRPDDLDEGGERAAEYTPRHARADLEDEAAEADVVEQSQEVLDPDEPGDGGAA